MVKVTRPIKKDSYFRHRLFDQLDQMRKSPVIWISAPAGAGKTTLVSSYVENRKLPCLWYQCDKDDGDLATFFYYMGLAAAKASPGKREPLPLFTPEYQQGIATFTRNYFQQLYLRLKKPSLMIMDNYQDILNASAFFDMMQIAFTHIPDGINLVIISRYDPPDRLVRLQANGYMTVLRWPDIRLSEEESRGIIQTRDKKLDSEEIIRNLYQASDGWAAGLVLMVTALQNQKIKSVFTGKQSYDEIIAYFGQEIFRHLNAKMRDFFLRTAFLPKMTACMAEQLTAEQSADDILQTMNKKNYFISRHGQAEPLYEYHPLYREFLLLQAKKILSARQLHEVQLQSANLLEQNGQTEAAVSLLGQLKDWQALANLVLAHAPDMLKRGRHHPLREWLESLPSDVLDQNPWLLYFKGMSILPFTPSQSKINFEKAFSAFQDSGDDLGAMLAASGVVNSIALSFDNFVSLDRWYVLLNELAFKVGQFPNEEIEAVVVASLVMASKLKEMSSVDIDAWEQRALKIAETSATINAKVQALHFIFWDCLLRKGTPAALPILGELQRISRMFYKEQPLITIIVHNTAMHYYLGAGLHGELIAAAKKGLEISEKTGVHIWDMWFYLYAAVSFVNCMDTKSAEEWLARVSSMVDGWPNWPNAVYHGQLMRIALIKKEYAAALHEGKRTLDFVEGTGSLSSLAAIQLMLGRLSWIMGKREEALIYLEQSNQYTEQKNSAWIMTAVLMTTAQFAFDQGDNSRALLLLRKSLRLARECDYVFTYYDDPTLTVRMCEKALEAGIEIEHVQTIIRRRGLIPEKPPVHLENWPWAVKIYTLGRFAVLIHDRPLESKRKPQQMPLKLLKAVIAQGGRDVAFEKLADLLWPDAEGDAAHHALETTLRRLRTLLGHEDAIELADGKLTLDSRYCWVDAWAFERLLGQADICKASGASRKKELIEKAIALYQGTFLEGERDAPWGILSAEHLKSRYFKSIWWLVNYLEEQGQWAQAADLCEKFLKVDACREDIYRNLMICYEKTQRKSEALLVYQRCCKTLSSVLGISPSPETQTLYKSILSEKLKALPRKI